MKKRSLWLLVFILGGLLPLLLPRLAPPGAGSFPQFGENDFIEYWTAARLGFARSDPYDPRLVLQTERAVGWREPQPLMMWNPPWFLPLLKGFSGDDFHYQARAFLGLNLGMLLVSLLLLVDALDVPRAAVPLAIVAGLASIPVFFALLLGQMSLLLTLAVSGILWSLVRRKDFLLGVFLFLATIKIHVIYLLLIPLVLGLPRIRLLRAGSVLLLLLVLAIGVEQLLAPNSLNDWLLRGRHRTSSLLVGVTAWKTTTIVTAVRELLFAWHGTFPEWPMIVVPAGAALLSAVFLFPNRRTLDWRQVIPPLVAISCVVSPFSWLFDASVTMVTQVAITSYAVQPGVPRRSRLLMLAAPLVLQLLLFTHIVCFPSPYSSYWYFCPALAAVFLAVVRHSRSIEPPYRSFA